MLDKIQYLPGDIVYYVSNDDHGRPLCVVARRVSTAASYPPKEHAASTLYTLDGNHTSYQRTFYAWELFPSFELAETRFHAQLEEQKKKPMP